MKAPRILPANSFTKFIRKYNMTGQPAISVFPALESGQQLTRGYEIPVLLACHA
jgi:hypothetical protein